MPMHDPTLMALGEDYSDIRESVRAICEGFPGSYWRELEDPVKVTTTLAVPDGGATS